MRTKISLGILVLCGSMSVTSVSAESDTLRATESDYLRVGNLIFISGQAAKSNEPGEAIAATLEKICAVASEAAAEANMPDKGCGNIVKLDVYLKNFGRDYPYVNEIMSKYFTSPYPTRNTVGVTHIPGDNSVEINAVMSLE